jgi:serine/threonine-protein kinase
MATCPTGRTRYPDDTKTCTADGAQLLPDEAVAEVEPDVPEGTMIGEYRVEAKLGQGGFGSVYRAVHPLIGKAAAIKVLNRQFSHNPQIVSRFVDEARAVNKIRHRNIIDIFSFGKLDDGRQYYVMELLEGTPLDVYLRQRGRLPPEEALPILQKVARALDAAHASGIAHRDLKPENVFLVFDEDGGIFPKLLDFGIAKLLGDSVGGSHKTRTGMAMGTPLYMSPEQCRGKNIDHRTDIYSFGIMAHELLTGRPPFDAEDPVDLLIKQTSHAAPSVSSLCPELPAALDAPILRMLEKDPAQRPQTMGEAMDALVEAARGAGIKVAATATRSAAGNAGSGPVRVVTGNDSGMGREESMAATQAAPAISESTVRRTDGAMQTSVPGGEGKAGAGRKAALVAGALVAVLGGGAAAFLMFRHKAEPVAEAQPRSEVSVTQGAQAPAPPPAPPKIEPVPSAQVPVPPAEVDVTFEGLPKDTKISRDGKALDAPGGKVRLPRGETFKLTFEAPGYEKLEREVRGEEGSVAITMKKARAATTKKGNTAGELENPF